MITAMNGDRKWLLQKNVTNVSESLALILHRCINREVTKTPHVQSIHCSDIQSSTVNGYSESFYQNSIHQPV